MFYYSNLGDNQRGSFGNGACSVQYNYLAHKPNLKVTQLLKQYL